jgi:hypothetical protein
MGVMRKVSKKDKNFITAKRKYKDIRGKSGIIK